MLLLMLATAPAISVRTLLPEMIDLDRLTSPLPYTHAQASSYDRRSDPGPHQDWFANGDAGNFVRIEHTEGRTEYVLADLKGPGVVDRFWSANPTGIVRFYFDGETTARFAQDMKQLLSGTTPHIGYPFAYEAAHGFDMYFPIPYAKSLKITVDDSEKEKPTSLYYHVGYRTYAPGTDVESFDPAVLASLDEEESRIGSALQRGEPSGTQKAVSRSFVSRPHRSSVALTLSGSGEVRQFEVKIPFALLKKNKKPAWTDPHLPHNVLRNLLMTIVADGHRCVYTPLGDFFGSAPGLNPYASFGASMSKDGTMRCELPMPYAKELSVQVDNDGPISIPLSVTARYDALAKVPPFRLHAQWTVDRGPSRPFKDMNLLTTSGPGNWVGCNLAVTNPGDFWWGEGDEKVYVNGESFPSTFGTGTEDFFGYAWGSTDLYQRPYHAQTRVDGPGTSGHSAELRWQFFDAIPFTTSLKFDLERWHWANFITTYARTAYWYAPADSPGPVDIDKSLLLPTEVVPYKVKGAVEGESLPILEATGGSAIVQSGFAQLSDGKQLWWIDPKVGDRLVVSVPIAKAGTYEVGGSFCHAQDYGIVRMLFDGRDLGTTDFYDPVLEWKMQTLGVFSLPKGKVRFEISCVGQNPKALDRRMFGLDYLTLTRRDSAGRR